ncbi:hypothetical protein DH2020_005115 [Rehmannia glutinosa]|uniref:Uncharacterized protein n=1 Tax=Rehmannia glutinosa TaxID=99300 RepID=A0ABR0XRC4_REHGL
MHERPHPFRRSGGDRGKAAQPPRQQHQAHPNPNFFPYPQPFHYQQNPYLLPHLNPFLQNPYNLPPDRRQLADSDFPTPRDPYNDDRQNRSCYNKYSKFPQQHGKVQNEMIEKLDRAVMRARRDLLASNENVSTWKVSQAALLKVKAESWESLGFQMQQVPSLKGLLVTEGKVNAFIHCFVAARRITSLYDLEMAICKSEGIEHFEELELGPLARHPLALHYFYVTADTIEAYRIRTEQIICYLCEFLDTHKRKEHCVDTFLDFMAMKQSVTSREKLCVRVQNFGFVPLRTTFDHKEFIAELLSHGPPFVPNVIYVDSDEDSRVEFEEDPEEDPDGLFSS